MSHSDLRTWSEKPWKLRMALPPSLRSRANPICNSGHQPEVPEFSNNSRSFACPAPSPLEDGCVMSWSHRQAAKDCSDPLSFSAVSISHPSGVSQVGTNVPSCRASHGKSSDVTRPRTHKLDDGADPDGRPPLESDLALTPIDIPAAPVPPAVIPPFVQDMLNDLPEGFLTGAMDFDRGFVIRTWYIHHARLTRSRISRNLHIRGMDRLIPLEDLAIDLIQPQPSRNRYERIIAFDLVISQGLYEGRGAGLISVYPAPGDQSIPRFAMAVSFPAQISGHDIVSALNFQEVCQQFRCDMFFRWTQIPWLRTPVHNMNHGDGFVVNLAWTSTPHGEASDLPSAGDDPGCPPDGDVGDQEMMPGPHEASESSQRSLSYSPSVAPDVSHSRTRQRVYIHRLHQPVVIAFVRWGTFQDLYDDVVQALHVDPVMVVTPHHVQAKPLGEQHNEESLIVQMLGDVPFASDEQLILLDVILHNSGSDGLSLAQQHTDRRVLSVQHTLTRSHLLQYAHVDNYCEFVQHRCLVRVNEMLWPLQDLGPRELTHGAYVQIIVPPPSNPVTPTVRTVALVEDASMVFTDARFASFYPSWFPGDAHSAGDAPTPSEEPAPETFDFKRAIHHPVVCCSKFTDDGYVDPVPYEHVGDDDVSSPPSFTSPLGVLPPIAPAGLGLPPLQEMADFNLQFGVTFRDHAVVDYEDQGPVLHVQTWYIHHHHRPQCLQPMLVQLESDPATWPAALCAPWRHLLQPGLPLAFREVRPNPPRLYREGHMAHVILEQGLHVPQYAALVSILAQGVHHDASVHLAVSVPRRVSAELILREVQLVDRCRVYRCTVWSGVMMFDPTEEELIFSGIGIHVNIHGPRFRHLLLGYGSQPFWSLGSHLSASSSSADVLPRRLPAILPPGFEASERCLQDLDDHTPHADGLFVAHLQVAWQTYLASQSHGPYRFQVMAWFCDHIRLPRSGESRAVLLPLDPALWQQTLIQAWSDWVLPGLSVQFYVVQPPPLDPMPVVAHIILAQNQVDRHASVLISSLVPDDNPWEPVHRVVKLPVVVDHFMLLHEGGLVNMCPPLSFNFKCQSWIGARELSDGQLYLASSGDGFLIAATHRPRELLLAWDPPESRIQRLFGHMSSLLTFLTCQVVQASQRTVGSVGDLDFSSHSCEGLSRCQTEFNITVCPVLSEERVAGLGSGTAHVDASSLDGLEDSVVEACLRRAQSLQLSSPLPELCVNGQYGSGSGPSMRSGQPVPLSLEACLEPTRSFDPDKTHTPECLPWSLDWPKVLFQSDVSFAQLPEHVPLTPVTLHALELPELYPEPAFANMTVYYVDGSSNAHSAAWSVIPIVYSSVGVPLFAGCLSGLVETCSSAPLWLGALAADNIAAELTAALAAMVASMCADASTTVVIRPDLRLSAMLANGLWQCKSHPQLVQLCHLCGQWFRKISGRFCEVRGHSKHPWNDLADSVARHCLHTQSAAGHLPWTFFARLAQSVDLNWAWLFDAPDCLHRCFPPGSIEGCWQVTPSVRRVSTPSLPSSVTQVRSVSFKCATANVLALGSVPAADGASSASERALRLDRQWHAHGLAVVGLQETRRPAGLSQTEHYVCYASGAQTSQRATHFGCELWLHRALPLDADGQLKFSDFKPAVVVADPRRLVVSLSHERLCLSFVVLHVPCVTAACPVVDVEAWWNTTLHLLQKAHLSPLTWIFADLNAPLASAPTAWFGLAGAEPTNPQGMLAERMLQTLDWYVPTTMPWCHVGPHATWTHPRGATARRDFVMCSASALELCRQSWVDTAFDGGFAHDDHFPVVLEVSGWIDCPSVVGKPVWDPLAFVDPVKCQWFQNALSTLPVPSWSIHVDSHAEVLEAQIMALARQCFSKTSFDRPRPRLREATLNLIQFKRSCLDYGRRQGLMQDCCFKAELLAVEKEVRKAVRADQRSFYDSLVDQLAQAGDLHNSKQVFRLLTRLGGRKSKATNIRAFPLLQQDGSPQTSHEAQQRLWMKQFANLEAGHVMSRDSLQQLMPPVLGVPVDDFDVAVLPTLAEVRGQIHRMKRGKAPGPDGIPPDVLKAGAEPLAQHLVVLMTKSAAHAREPRSWRGGRLVPLHKGKLPKSDPAGYRSIFLNNFLTKAYHSVIRKHLVTAWSQVLEHLQLGGRKGLGCDTARHMVQAHLTYGVASKQPCGVVFVDFKSAFYSVLRQCLFDHQVEDDGFVVAMHRLGVHPDEVNRLLRNAQGDAAIRNISPHALAVLRDVLRSTYFEIDGIPEVATTNRGTRPGDPIGDISFNLLMAVMLQDITQAIACDDCTWEGSPIAQVDFAASQAPAPNAWAEIAYVDDLAILLRSSSNAQMRDLTHRILQAVLQAAHQRGLELTYGAGKTKSCGVFVVPSPVPCVNSCAMIRVIGFETKIRVFDSLIMSRLLFNAHVWCMVSEVALEEWEAGLRPLLFSVVRPKLRGQPPFSFSTVTLCGLCQMLSPRDALHVARLRYFRRLVAYCPSVLWNLLRAADGLPGAWLTLLRDSFAWLVRFSSPHFGLTAQSSLHDWLTYTALDGRWKGHLRRAIASCKAYRFTHASTEVWHAWLSTSFAQNGVGFSLPDPLQVALPWTCDLCDRAFHNKLALSMHAVKVHGYQTAVRHYAIDGQCSNCGRDFHHRARLCAHLRTATQCLERIRASFPPLTREAMATLNEEDRIRALQMRQQGWLPTKAEQPVVRAYGPSLPPAGSVDATLLSQKWIARNGTDADHPFMQLAGCCLNPVEGVEDAVPECPSAELDEVVFLVHSDEGHIHGDLGVFSMTGLARLHAVLHIKTLCFIHFYSGFRRVGDLQHQIEAHHVQGVYHVFCLSVDFCLHGETSDLASHRNRQFWTKQILGGAVLGVGGGVRAKRSRRPDSLPEGRQCYARLTSP
eukprot:s445_g3.t1